MNALSVVTAAVRTTSVVTLTGPAGSGKSLLAHRAAPRVTRELPGGGRLLDLHRLEYASELLAEIAHVLDMPPTPFGREQALAYVRTGLQERAGTLFVLDGIDDLLPRCRGVLRDLISSSPQHRWLVTSQEPIGLSNEKVMPLAGAVPSPVVASTRNVIRLQV